MTKKHAKFGSPSGLYALEKCPGKIAFGKDLPELPESEYAREGTYFHEKMEQALRRVLDGEPNIDKLLADCEYPDMPEHVQNTCDAVMRLYNGFISKHDTVQIYFELPVQLTEDVFGTSDVVIYGVNKKTGKTDVIALDYKYGMGVPVYAEENLQGIAYLLAALKTIKSENIGVGRIYIAQVRLEDGWSHYDLKQSDFSSWQARINEIVLKAKAIYDGEAPMELHAGSHCRFCKAAAVCPENKKEHYDQLQVTATELSVDEVLSKLSLDQKVEIFKRKQRVEDFLDAVAKDLLRHFELGVTHKDLKLIETKGRRKWGDEKRAAEALKKAGIKDPYNKKLIGITEAEKILGKGEVDDLVVMSEGRKELVRVEHKQNAIEIEGAKELE